MGAEDAAVEARARGFGGRDGRVVEEGAPGDIVTAGLVEEVFRLPCRVIEDSEAGTPLVVPAARRPAGVATR